MEKEYTTKINELLTNILEKETNNIEKAAKIIFDAMKNDKLLHVFATGHSHMVAEELFYRAGGLVQIDPILVPALMQHEGAIRSTELERLSGLAESIYNHLDLEENEPFLIVSNSGINNVPIEMATIAKKNNHPVIVITSAEVSKMLKTRHKGGLHLYDVADVVIDNHTPYGDGLINHQDTLIGASSTIACSYIVQLIVLKIIELYDQNNLKAPIYVSANTPNGDEHNKELIKKYQKRIKMLY